MRYWVAAVCAPLVLSACGSDVGTAEADGDGDGSVSMAEAGEAIAASGMKPEPGLYRVSTEIKNMQVTGMSVQLSGDSIGMSMNNTLDHCVTQEEADSGYEEMMKEGQNGTCTYDRFELSGDTFDGVMVCSTDQGEMRIDLSGSVTPTTSEMDASAAMTIAGLGEVKTDMRVTQERIGDCPG